MSRRTDLSAEVMSWGFRGVELYLDEGKRKGHVEQGWGQDAL